MKSPARLATILIGLATALSAHATPDARNDAEIAHLLAYIGASGCTFIRNGDPHPATEASAHLAMKYDKAKSRLSSSEQFIERVASRSFLSGENYLVQCGASGGVPTGPWLSTELRRWRQSQGKF